jgi:DNA-directed RNA polymerase specialized sigma24 family protein
MHALLTPYLDATDRLSEDAHLQELIQNHAAPLIRRVVITRLAGLEQDVEDVCSEAHMELLLWLRRLKANPSTIGIDDFPAYISAIAANACNRFFRRRNPGRAQLKSQIRYVLATDSRFAIRDLPNGSIGCGLAEWKQADSPLRNPDMEIPIESDRDLAVLLERIFRAGGAMELEAVTGVVARVWAIARDVHVSDNELHSVRGEPSDMEQSIDRKRYAARLWGEICTLPLNQRTALLLHFRDGRGNPALSLFPLSGIAFLPDIAATLGWGEDKLAEVWSRLPLDDNSIAEILLCSRQQVINLRMSARKRLANRMGSGR